MSLKPDPILDLEGRDLGDGWKVGKLVKAGPVGSGGHFSICYIAHHNGGTTGFLKVFDFRGALEAADLMRELQALTTSYNFERDLLDFCKDKKIRKVVMANKHGDLEVKGVPLDRAYYIVFELADGDARAQMENSKRKSFSWIYSALHHVALGLRGLHSNLVYHQDLKPSNVLVFDNGKNNKIADLGRSHKENSASPNEDWDIPGFIAYAPPEQLYGYAMPDSKLRRASGDLYQLGSLMLFFFTGVMATPAVLSWLQDEHKPAGHHAWTGTYGGVLPYLDAAFSGVIDEFEAALKAELPQNFHAKFVPTTLALFKILSAMRPEERGHPSTRKNGNSYPYELERVISELAHLSKLAMVIDRLNAKAA